MHICFVRLVDSCHIFFFLSFFACNKENRIGWLMIHMLDNFLYHSNIAIWIRFYIFGSRAVKAGHEDMTRKPHICLWVVFNRSSRSNCRRTRQGGLLFFLEVVLRVLNFDMMLELISSSSAHETLLGYWIIITRIPKQDFQGMWNDLSAACEWACINW